MSYLYWRGNSLWARLPIPGKPACYPLGIKRLRDSKTETLKCEASGWEKLTEWRDKASKGLPLFESPTASPALRKPWVYEIVWKYWREHYRSTKSGRADWWYFFSVIRSIGDKTAESLTGVMVNKWMDDFEKKGFAVNTRRNLLRVLRSSFSHSKISFPENVDKLPEGNTRLEYLNGEMFERNYHFLRTHKNPGPRQFSKFYLALWETIRRPKEVANYRIQDVNYYQKAIRVRPEISKTGKSDVVAISPRLWEIIKAELPRKTGILFPTLEGNPWLQNRSTNYQRHMELLRKEFGNEATWCRDTRRGSATFRAEEINVAAVNIKDQAGWKTWSSFSRYHIGTLTSKRKAVCFSHTNFIQIQKAA